MEAVRHMRSLFDTSHDEGYEEGESVGLAKGLAKGLEKGRAEGELSKAIAIARNLKSLGLGIDQIIAATGLSEEQQKEI